MGAPLRDTIPEQPGCRGVVALVRQACDPEDPLLGQAKDGPAGDHDPHAWCSLEKLRELGRRALRKLLEVVEREQQPPVRERSDELLAVVDIDEGDAECGSHGEGGAAVVGRGLQGDVDDLLAQSGLGECFEQEPRLANAARPNNRDQARVRLADEISQAGKLPLPADERRGRCRRRGALVKRAGGWRRLCFRTLGRGRGRGGILNLGDRGDEAVAASVDRLDVALLAAVVSQGFARRHDAAVERGFGHVALGPNGVEDLIFAQAAVVVPHEQPEHFEDLRFHGDGPARLAKLERWDVDLEVVEGVAGGVTLGGKSRRHGSSVGGQRQRFCDLLRGFRRKLDARLQPGRRALV